MKNKVIGIILTISMIATLTACGGAVPTATAEAPANVDTATETTEENAETVAEGPCKDGHTWVEATCTEPKTCSVCGATEGEALGHEWLENTPNYQKAKTCSRCNETEGEPLEAEFEKRGLTVVSEWDKPYNITAICNDDTSKTTEGKIKYTNLKVVPSDDEMGLKEADGYEWLIFDRIITYDDENVRQYGVCYLADIISDYYNPDNTNDAGGGEFIAGKTDIDTLGSLTVNYNGKNYPECKLMWGKTSAGWSDDGVATFKDTFYFRVPVGYDGLTISNGGGSSDEVYKKLNADENTKEIDIIDDTFVNFRIIPN